MSLTLYAHPFAAYCWKVLIALYENARRSAIEWSRTRQDGPSSRLWPIKKFPVLRDGEATIIESSIIVEYLMRRYPGPTRLIPEGIDAALKVRFMDRFFDNYVMTPMQKLVSDRMRAEASTTPRASQRPGRCWTSPMDGSKSKLHHERGQSAAILRWGIAPPLPRFSMRIGCIQSATDSQAFAPTALDFLLGRPSPAPLMRRDPTASYSLRARQIATDKKGRP